jgi:hypothetical protein
VKLRKREVRIETLTPGARAPRRTAVAEDTSPVLDFDSEWS